MYAWISVLPHSRVSHSADPALANTKEGRASRGWGQKGLRSYMYDRSALRA
jgi:hypothetical protein